MLSGKKCLQQITLHMPDENYHASQDNTLTSEEKLTIARLKLSRLYAQRREEQRQKQAEYRKEQCRKANKRYYHRKQRALKKDQEYKAKLAEKEEKKKQKEDLKIFQAIHRKTVRVSLFVPETICDWLLEDVDLASYKTKTQAISYAVMQRIKKECWKERYEKNPNLNLKDYLQKPD